MYLCELSEEVKTREYEQQAHISTGVILLGVNLHLVQPHHTTSSSPLANKSEGQS